MYISYHITKALHSVHICLLYTSYTAVDYLIRQGHRKIAVLGGTVTSYPCLMRRQGAEQAMEDAGIVFNDKLYGLSNYDF